MDDLWKRIVEGDGDAGGDDVSGSRSFEDQAQDLSATAKRDRQQGFFQRLFLYHVMYERLHNSASGSPHSQALNAFLKVTIFVILEDTESSE